MPELRTLYLETSLSREEEPSLVDDLKVERALMTVFADLVRELPPVDLNLTMIWPGMES